MTDERRPLYFGRAEAPLFGMFHPARGEVRGAVVLVNPWGYESVCAQRSYRHLAEQLARAGFAVLRYDHHGTGDSAGDERDTGCVEAWLGGIGLAIDEITKLTGVSSVTLFGTRLGALLACVCAASRSDVHAVALLAPVTSGRAYVREMKAFRLMAEGAEGAPSRDREPSEDEEAAGFRLTEETRKALSRLDALKLSGNSPVRALILGRDDLPGDGALAEALSLRGTETTSLAVAGYTAMMQDPHKSIVPDALIAAIVAWLGEGATTVASTPPSTITVAILPDGVREEAIDFGRQLFGVLSEPADPTAPRSRTAVLYANAGAIHRIGPNRMVVRAARAWATLGFTTLRFDVSGIGDSATRHGERENWTYPADPVPSVDEAISALQARGFTRFVVMGLCSGGYIGFHAGLRAPMLAGVVLINPQTFHYKEGESLDVARSKNFSQARYYQRTAFSAKSWQKAMRGEVSFRRIARVVGSRAYTVVKERVVDRFPSLGRAPGEHDVGAELEAIAARGVDIEVVFSDGDPGRDYLESQVGRRRMRRFLKKGVLRITLVEGADHTFTPLWSQGKLEAVLTEHLVRRFGAVIPSG